MRNFSWLFAFILFAATSLLSQEGMYTEHESKTQGIMGQPDRESQSRTWLLEDRLRSEEGQNVTIVRFDLGKVWTIMLDKNTYFEMSVDELAAMAKMGMGMMQQTGELKFNFESTGRTKKINNWNCKEVVAKSSFMTQHMWLSEDLPFNKDDYYKFYKNSPQIKELVESFYKAEQLKGYPVLTETEVNMMGMKIQSSSRLVKIEKKKLEAGLFELPANVKQVDNPMQQMLDQMKNRQQ